MVVLGVFLALLLIEAGLRLGGAVIIFVQHFHNRGCSVRQGEYRILCLGESTTQGEYPPFLEKELNRRKPGVKFKVFDEGVTGTRTQDILAKLESHLDHYHPQMVITMMGINDQGPHLVPEPVQGREGWLGSFRVYKLLRLLGMHVARRFDLHQRGDHEDLHVLTELKKQVTLGPENEQAYFALGAFYKEHAMVPEALEAFTRVVSLNPRHDRVYIELGELYGNQQKRLEAINAFTKAIELGPDNDEAYESFTRFCEGPPGKLSDAGQWFEQMVSRNPRDYRAYAQLGQIYFDQNKARKAMDALQKVVELNPSSAKGYLEWGSICLQMGLFSKAEALIGKALELNPGDISAGLLLGRVYYQHGKFPQAEAVFRRMIEINPHGNNAGAYASLALIALEKGDVALAKTYEQRSGNFQWDGFAPLTIYNYHRLRNTLEKRRITHVCVQYPLRHLEPLKRIFQGNDKGIIFVDNEKVFKEAVGRDGYYHYFKDIFGGNFGHCKEPGNRLLAANIAARILTQAFGY